MSTVTCAHQSEQSYDCIARLHDRIRDHFYVEADDDDFDVDKDDNRAVIAQLV
jgi:hypothetical protein